jgi:hypothetical protein
MLTQPLLDKLSQLGLAGFRSALEEQLHSPHYADLSFEERLGLLLDIEDHAPRQQSPAAPYPGGPLPASGYDGGPRPVGQAWS